MKTTRTLIAMGFVLALAALWLGRVAWRKHHHLVTMHTRNAPLAEVIRQLERQTSEKVLLDKKLDAKVTIEVKNMPLTNVLDLISDQAGARWGKTYAVYDHEGALRRLESALHGETKLEEVGWTNLAPRINDADFPGIDSFGAGGGPARVVRASPEGDAPSQAPMFFQNDEDVRRFVPENLRDKVTITHGNEGATRTITATEDQPNGRRVINLSTNSADVEKDGPGSGAGRPMKSLVVRRTAGPGGTRHAGVAFEPWGGFRRFR